MMIGHDPLVNNLAGLIRADARRILEIIDRQESKPDPNIDVVGMLERWSEQVANNIKNYKVAIARRNLSNYVNTVQHIVTHGDPLDVRNWEDIQKEADEAIKTILDMQE